MTDWVYCPSGRGYRYENGERNDRIRHFKARSVGILEETEGDFGVIWFIGADETWCVDNADIFDVDVNKTGDRFEKKICNICHRLLSVDMFDINQRNRHGLIRRPSCRECRLDIDRRAPKSQQAKQMEKTRPKKGTAFKCPICQKRSIVGITARIVADHNHHTGDIRDWLCDSCNTGLGRFKNGQDCLRDALVYLEERDTFSTKHSTT